MKLRKIYWKKIPISIRATIIGGLFVLLAAVVTVIGNYIVTLGLKKDSKSENASPSSTIVFSNRLVINANEIALDVGTVSKVVKGINSKNVVIFEENHFSRRGQIEIAIMLNRLYEKYGLRHIGLEGFFEAEGTLNATWYHPSLEVNQVLSPKEKIVVQLLTEGEISSSEMLSLIYPDIEVYGLEKAAEYNMDIPSERAFAEINAYLIAIAEKSLSQSQIIEINRLVNENKNQDALELLLNVNSFTKQQHQLLSQTDKILSAEEMRDIIKKIKAKAEEVDAILVSSYKENMDEVLEFYTRASMRSETISANLLKLIRKFPEEPVAIIVGAAHTKKISKLLNESGVSHIILTPISLAQQSATDKLSEEAFVRNLRGLSVDETYGVGALLDDRVKKPHPKLHKTWLRSKIEIYYLTALIAYTDSRDDPLQSTYISNVLTKMQYITPITNSFQTVGNETIFSVKAQVEDLSKPLTVWIRTSFVRETSLLKLENALKNQLFRFESHNWQNTSTKLRAINVTFDVLALFSTDLSNLQKISLL